MEKTMIAKSPLKDKIVKLVPVVRKGGWLPDSHEGKFMYDRCAHWYCCPIDVDPLTEEERAWFESPASNMGYKPGDLSIYKKENNFWQKISIRVDRNGLTLDLSNPKDYLDYKVLLANKSLIAPDKESRFKKASFKFYISDEAEENESKVKEGNKLKQAWMEFGKMDGNFEKLFSFLQVYANLYKIPGNKVPRRSNSITDLTAMAQGILENNIDSFIEVSTDPLLEEKAFIINAIAIKALDRDSDGIMFEGKLLGKSINDVIEFFKNPKNQDVKIKVLNKKDLI